ncbi:MAG: Na+/H+ antiporter NhaC family protein [Pseudomonadota bacterium]
MLNRIGVAAVLLLVSTLCVADEGGASHGIWSLLPAFITIVIALLLRSVIPALFIGLWLGASLVNGFSPMGILEGLFATAQTYVVNVLADSDRATIIVFTCLIAGMVGITTRNGAMKSLVDRVISVARTRNSAQLSVGGMGLIIFFDDYANTLVVGNTARAMTDRLKVSREKLAYLVDATAAPIACLALVSTWIGYEVSLIDDAIKDLQGLPPTSAYLLFVNSLAYSFYPILAIVFVFMVGGTGRDFGPMLTAENRALGGDIGAQSSGAGDDEMQAAEGANSPISFAILPIVAVLVTLGAGLYLTGEGESLVDIVGSADAYKAMIWSSLVGTLVAFLTTLIGRTLTLDDTVSAWFGGLRSVLPGVIVLILAWALSEVTSELGAADYVVQHLSDAIKPELLPVLVFLLAAVTAFGTGASWGTMAILVPLVVPLCWALLVANGQTADLHILYSSIACVLTGAVWGDHCSPISDTTVLSSIASGCDHVEHVRTQLPYALSVGVVSILLGTLPSAFGLSPFICMILGGITLFVLLKKLGRPAGQPGGEPAHDGA